MGAERAACDARAVGPLRRVLLSCLVLLGAYLVASTALDAGGYLGTDTGAKVATLHEMVADGSWHPDVPYWARSADPEGRVHPLYQTHRVDDRFVNVTTLPMLLAARPLYDLGGYRLALLLPMAGAIGASLAALALARRLRGEAAGWAAFWTIGLASPIVIYALDLWEHSIGVACTLGAVALLAGIVDREPPVLRAVGAGLLLGVAATMRTEAFVYAAVAVGACGLVLLARRQLSAAVATGTAAVAGFALPWIGNRLLESALGGTDRGTRASGAVSSGLGDLGDRAHEALITLFAARSDDTAAVLAVGALLAVLVIVAVRLDRSGDHQRARRLAGVVVVLEVVLALAGLGFVPGLFAAAPLAAAGLAVAPTTTAGRYVLGVALGALPLVWAFQYLGGALPQWAGRYALASCALLVVLGVVVLADADRATRLALTGAAVAVTLAGVAWTSQRTHDVADWFRAADARPEDVLISRNGFHVREGGAAGTERRWLTAVSDADLDFAVHVVLEQGLRTFAVVDEHADAPGRLDGARLRGTDATDFLGAALYVHSYELPPS
jgi:hypothetical protein